MEEIWKLVPCGTKNDYYEASSCGRIRHTITNYLKIQKAPTALYERVSYSMKHPTKQAFRTVHDLVCSAFHGERPTGYHCNHKDGDKLNNHPGNLEWVTPSENTYHAVRLGLKPVGARHHWNSRPETRAKVTGENGGMSKLNDWKVRVIRRLAEEKMTHREIAALFSIVPGTIGFVVQRKTWRHV